MAANKKRTKQAAAARNQGLPWSGWVGLGAVVAVLVVLVLWSLPNDGANGDGSAAGEDGAAGGSAAATGDGGAGARSTGELRRLPEATCELAVLTDRPDASVNALASADAIGELLDVRHCGGACDAVKKALGDSERTELEVMKSEDFILPPEESFTAIAPGLTPEERHRAATAPLTLVVRTRFLPSVEQLGARACYAAAGAAAEKLGGFVYDEAGRRIEGPAQFVSHAITVPMGQPVFAPRQISIQIYRQDDGTARLLTLGMARYGSPDFIARGPSMDEAPRVALVMNAIAAKAAAMKTSLPFTVTLDDVARVTGKKPSALAKDPAASKPVRIDAVEADRTEGDPDNEIVELVPPEGATGGGAAGGAASGGASGAAGDTSEAWTGVLASLFGDAPAVVASPANPAALDAIAARARKDLPRALARWRSGEGTLFVKGPFDAGDAGTEWMWIEVTSCDQTACNGVLSNDPGYATNLAQGKPASIPRAKLADWLLDLKDGGTAGGASIKALTPP